MSENPARRHFYGRRMGPKLTDRQQRLVEERLPSLRPPIDREASPLDPRLLFAQATSTVWLEIGFGGGEHLAFQAASHPQIGFIGCEPFINGVAKLLVAIDANALANIRIHDDDALLLVDRLAGASIDRIFLLHPDPWPKSKHWKRRFINDVNLDRLARVLKPGGELRFASDHPGYVTWTRKHLARRVDFILVSEEERAAGPAFAAGSDAEPVCENATAPITRYAEKALREGRAPMHLVFRRV